jgi:hypothetical protein
MQLATEANSGWLMLLAGDYYYQWMVENNSSG